MKVLVFIMLLVPGLNLFAQINVDLKRQLDSVMEIDQRYRNMMSYLTTREKVDSVAKTYNIPPGEVVTHFWKLQNSIDSSNVLFIAGVISKYGYPGKSLVGAETGKTAWFIIQHSTRIGEFLPVIRKAGEQGEIENTLVAMMEDRNLMYNGKEQIYGTQGAYRKLRSGTSENIIWPIRDPEKVNERRKSAGFDTTVEEYAKKLNIHYRVVKLADLEDGTKSIGN